MIMDRQETHGAERVVGVESFRGRSFAVLWIELLLRIVFIVYREQSVSILRVQLCCVVVWTQTVAYCWGWLVVSGKARQPPKSSLNEVSSHHHPIVEMNEFAAMCKLLCRASSSSIEWGTRNWLAMFLITTGHNTHYLIHLWPTADTHNMHVVCFIQETQRVLLVAS